MHIPYRTPIRFIYANDNNRMSILSALLAIFDVPPAPGTPPEPDTSREESDPPPDSLASRSPRPIPRHMPRLHPRILVGYGSVFGLMMVIAAWLWMIVIRGRSLADWFPAERWLLDIGIGLAVGALFVLVMTRIEQHVPALKRIENLFLALLDMRALRWHHAVMLGVLAGFPEELLFRGSVQPELGMIPAAIIFGALHAATPAYFIYATVAGALLGGLTAWRGGLWSAIAAHTLIDVVMFLLLIRTWQRSQREDAAPPAA